MPAVLIVRGDFASPWELGSWQALPDRYEVSYLLSPSNRFAAPDRLRAVPARTLRSLLPRGAFGELAAGALGDRYLHTRRLFADAEIVHAAELGFWFAAEAARCKPHHHFKLVQTVWETLPHMSVYRNREGRRNRELVLAETDLFLPVTQRAAHALSIEGVEEERMLLCPPGIDLARFGASRPEPPPAEHTIVAPGRLVWEKGHHDVMRALAALHRGMVRLPNGELTKPRLAVIGSGPEEHRLRAHAAELGLREFVEFRNVPYEQMPGVFWSASAMVLASQSSATGARHLFDVPRAFWEEQFGMVLAEAMASGLAIVTTTNGAIPEVIAGTEVAQAPDGVAPAALVASGDWMGIARALADGPLSRAPAARVSYPRTLVGRYSTTAAAKRLAAAYDSLLSS